MSQPSPDADNQPASQAAASGQPGQASEPRSAPRLSLIQILATVLAAVTSTLALSKLGAAGTVFGAAVASLITVVGNYLYTRSLVRTHQAVRKIAQTASTTVIPAVAGHGDAQEAKATPDAVTEPSQETTPTSPDESSDEPDETVTDDDPDLPDRWVVTRWNRLAQRFGVVPLVIASLVLVFGLIIAVVAITEAVSGKPLGQIGHKQPNYSGFLFDRNPPSPSVPPTPGADATDQDSEPTGPEVALTDSPGTDAPSPTTSKTKETKPTSPTGLISSTTSPSVEPVPDPAISPTTAPQPTAPPGPTISPGSSETANPTVTITSTATTIATVTATAPATSQSPSQTPDPAQSTKQPPNQSASSKPTPTPTPSTSSPEPSQSEAPPEAEDSE